MTLQNEGIMIWAEINVLDTIKLLRETPADLVKLQGQIKEAEKIARLAKEALATEEIDAKLSAISSLPENGANGKKMLATERDLRVEKYIQGNTAIDAAKNALAKHDAELSRLKAELETLKMKARNALAQLDFAGSLLTYRGTFFD